MTLTFDIHVGSLNHLARIYIPRFKVIAQLVLEEEFKRFLQFITWRPSSDCNRVGSRVDQKRGQSRRAILAVTQPSCMNFCSTIPRSFYMIFVFQIT